MKKLFLFLLVMVCTYSAWTQVSAGPVLGLNLSNVKGGTNDQPNKFKFGFRAGVFLCFDISDVVSFQPEMLYSTRGYKQKVSFSSSASAKDTILTNNFSYIDFPFMLNMKIGTSAFMGIGPQIGYIINAKQKGTISLSSNGSPVQIRNVDTSSVYGYNTTEYSLALGGGYRFKFPLVASLRATYGLSKLYAGEYFSHNLSFYISVSYFFGGDGGGGGGRSTIYKTI